MSNARASLHLNLPGPNICSAMFCRRVADASSVGWWRPVSPLGIRAASVGVLASGKADGVCLLGTGHTHWTWLGCLGFTASFYGRVLQLRGWTTWRQGACRCYCAACVWMEAAAATGNPALPILRNLKVSLHCSRDVRWHYKSQMSGSGLHFNFIIFSKTLIFIGFEVWGFQWPKASLNINYMEMNE